MRKSVLLSGSAHPYLAKEIAQKLKIGLGEIEISQFANGERKVWIKEEITDKPVFIIQPTIADNDIIELCLITDAAKQKEAKRVIGVIPWFSYSAQDDVFREGEPLSAKVIVKILEASGIDEVMVVDPHSRKFVSFFIIPVVILSALQVFASLFKKKSLKNFIVATLDLGAMERSLKFAQSLGLPLVFLQKTPRDRQTGKIEFLGIKGKVVDKNVLLFDDFVSTGQTLIKAAKFLKKEGAKTVTACVTHYLPVEGLPERLKKSPIDKIFVSNTLPILKERKFAKLEIVSIAPLLANAIKNLLK